MRSKALILLALMCFTRAEAIDTDKWAHFGLSYGITTVSYGLCKQAFHLGPEEPKWPCMLMGVILSTSLGLMKEMSDRRLDGNDLDANLAGNIAAGVSIMVFEF